MLGKLWSTIKANHFHCHCSGAMKYEMEVHNGNGSMQWKLMCTVYGGLEGSLLPFAEWKFRMEVEDGSLWWKFRKPVSLIW